MRNPALATGQMNMPVTATNRPVPLQLPVGQPRTDAISRHEKVKQESPTLKRTSDQSNNPESRDKAARPRKKARTPAWGQVYFAGIDSSSRDRSAADVPGREIDKERRVSEAPAAEVRRRRDEGMRGSMRNEGKVAT